MAKGKYEYWLTDDGLLLLSAWARDGLTDEELAVKIGINRATLYEWKNKYPDISDSLKKGKEIADIKVENALYKRALGYAYTEDRYTMIEMNQDEYFQKREAFINEYKFNHPEASQEEINRVKLDFPKTKEVLIERKTKEVIPDTIAQIFWLKNRQPDKWRDKRGSNPNPLPNTNQESELTLEELRELAKNNPL